MSVYAPTFRSSNLVNIGQLDTELSTELASKLALNYGPGSLVSTAADAYLINQSFTCEVDDLVRVDFGFSIGATSATLGVDAIGRLDGVAVSPIASLYAMPNGTTSGWGLWVQGHYYTQDITGSHSAQVYLDFFTGAGTVYSARQYMTVTLTKRR
jgi:hypothetical protein